MEENEVQTYVHITLGEKKPLNEMQNCVPKREIHRNRENCLKSMEVTQQLQGEGCEYDRNTFYAYLKSQKYIKGNYEDSFGTGWQCVTTLEVVGPRRTDDK